MILLQFASKCSSNNTVSNFRYLPVLDTRTSERIMYGLSITMPNVWVYIPPIYLPYLDKYLKVFEVQNLISDAVHFFVIGKKC